MECPQCGSEGPFYRDGLRVLSDGSTAQRWLCRNCFYRFSEPVIKQHIPGQILKVSNPGKNHANRGITRPNFSREEILNGFPFNGSEQIGSHDVSSVGKGLNALRIYNRECRVGATSRGAKNLDTATELKTVAGESRGIQLKWTLQFLWTLKKEGIKETTAKMYWYYLTNLESHGASLYDPESVKAAIANMENWDTNTKASAVTAYSKYLQVFGGTWKKPRYKRERKIPFLPTEKELDCLMNASHKKLATYLRLLKETGIRANEAWQLKWIDIDIERSIITLNKTEKHGTPRNFRVSPGLIGMLNALPKKSDKVFNGSLIGFSKGFRRFRARIANKMQNPRLLEIHFHTYRHWFATMEYHRTKDILHVKERLGHKSVNTTEIYMHLIDFENDDFYSAAAGTIEEAKKLVESGFEYVCDVQDVKLFRKRK